jgi:hypothetical protein
MYLLFLSFLQYAVAAMLFMLSNAAHPFQLYVAAFPLAVVLFLQLFGHLLPGAALILLLHLSSLLYVVFGLFPFNLLLLAISSCTLCSWLLALFL